MAYFHTNVLDSQIKALPTVDTASGSVATFDTDMTENLIECVCDIQYSQAEGTPTPSSPIPITVYNALNLSHSGADTSNPTIINIPFGQTVAKGTLDVLSGKLTIEFGCVDMGSLPWTFSSTYFWATFYDVKENTPNLFSSIYSLDNSAIVNMPDYTFKYTKSTTRFIVKNSDYNDANAFKTAMTGVPIVYELETPQVIQLDSNQVQALLNENNIWCDTNGDTSVKYLLSVGKKIS